MAHGKSHLPSKLCAACDRPFTWRKKWKAVWDEVRFCSDACRTGRRDRAAERPTTKAKG